MALAKEGLAKKCIFQDNSFSREKKGMLLLNLCTFVAMLASFLRKWIIFLPDKIHKFLQQIKPKLNLFYTNKSLGTYLLTIWNKV